MVYSYYNVAKGNKFEDVMKLALIKAKEMDYDVFNALDIMKNGEVLTDLKFGVGDGFLYYYLYNWKLSGNMHPSSVGVILV